jgi:hypothetical protein
MSNKKFKVGINTYIRKRANPKYSCTGCCFESDILQCSKTTKMGLVCGNHHNGQDYIFIKVS